MNPKEIGGHSGQKTPLAYLNFPPQLDPSFPGPPLRHALGSPALSPTKTPPFLVWPLSLTHKDAAHQGHGQAQEEAKYLGLALHSLGPVRLITPEAKGMDYPGVQTGSK